MHCLPVIEFMDNVKTEIMHQVTHADGDNDRLIGCHSPQRTPVEMIEVRVGNENKIDLRQVMNLKPGPLQSFDHLQPFRPVGINQDIDLVRLQQKRSMPDPGEANFAFSDCGEVRLKMVAGAPDKKRRNQDAGEEIALVPVRPRTQANTGGAFRRSAILRFLANDVPAALFRERNRHSQASI